MQNLGPHGVGDPEDKTLRKVEIEVLIPKKMREIASREKCAFEVKDFSTCAKEQGLGVIFSCRDKNQKLWDCLTTWYTNESFKEHVKGLYLEERTEFRRTGIKKPPVNERKEMRLKREMQERMKKRKEQLDPSVVNPS